MQDARRVQFARFVAANGNGTSLARRPAGFAVFHIRSQHDAWISIPKSCRAFGSGLYLREIVQSALERFEMAVLFREALASHGMADDDIMVALEAIEEKRSIIVSRTGA